MSPFPASLESKRGIHPRIFLDKARIAELKQQITTTHKSLWQETLRQADRAVQEGPPEYRGNGDGEGRWGFEQLWQRNVGNYMSTLAMAWALTEDRKYLDSARQWALASCGYKTWGGLGWADGIDLAASHQLFGLGLIYDWCYDGLDEEAKQIIRDTLIRRTSTMVGTVLSDKVWWHRADIRERIWYRWQNAYLQNHLWVNMCGVTVAGLAVFDEVDDASLWIGLALDKFRGTMAVLGDDGASHEGVQYWDYGVENLLKFMNVARDLLDTDMFDNEWFRITSKYRIYLSLPLNSWTSYSNVVDIGDCSRESWYSDYNLRALASEYDDGYAQWLARQVDEAKDNSPRLRWLNLIWYDPAVPEKPLSGLPAMRHFEDMGIVSARSDWSGDESLVVFKCGPFIGHKGITEMPYDAASAHHVHPDANHFVLFGGGECLIRDDGYHAKWTDQHNTLLIDGKGQLGEGGLWFDGTEAHRLKARPRIVRAVSTPELDLMTGDATVAYPQEFGLQRFTRHILFVKPDILIVADDIVVNSPRDLELRFHPEQFDTVQDNGSFLFLGKKSVLRLDPLTSDGVDISAEVMTAEHDSGELDPINTVRLRTHRQAWRNAVALSWSKKSGKPAKITLYEDGDVWTFVVDGRAVTLEWVSGEAGVGE
ncbi:MAG: DUF4962 domain-containing protein [Candidatus Latescibacteria bacterium]|nr:DUF4962 domain-containing protein [Candidatus Latescibacterota bacterium]